MIKNMLYTAGAVFLAFCTERPIENAVTADNKAQLPGTIERAIRKSYDRALRGVSTYEWPIEGVGNTLVMEFRNAAEQISYAVVYPDPDRKNVYRYNYLEFDSVSRLRRPGKYFTSISSQIDKDRSTRIYHLYKDGNEFLAAGIEYSAGTFRLSEASSLVVQEWLPKLDMSGMMPNRQVGPVLDSLLTDKIEIIEFLEAVGFTRKDKEGLSSFSRISTENDEFYYLPCEDLEWKYFVVEDTSWKQLPGFIFTSQDTRSFLIRSIEQTGPAEYRVRYAPIPHTRPDQPSFEARIYRSGIWVFEFDGNSYVSHVDAKQLLSINSGCDDN